MIKNNPLEYETSNQMSFNQIFQLCYSNSIFLSKFHNNYILKPKTIPWDIYDIFNPFGL